MYQSRHLANTRIDVADALRGIAADGCFTNRADLSPQYMIDHGLRGRSDIPNPFHPGSTYDNSQVSRIVPDAVKTLERLGYLYRSSNLCHIAARNGE